MDSCVNGVDEDPSCDPSKTWIEDSMDVLKMGINHTLNFSV